LFHPLVGVPPLYAASLATTQGLAMQRNSARFFQNNAQPGGILTAPGHIKEETAIRIRTSWAEKYTGDNAGKIAVLGDGLKYEPLAVNATDSAMVEQLKWSDEKICSVYKVPPYKVHVGPPPTYQQSETLDRKYYSDCLQRHIEAIESLLDEGLGYGANLGAEFDLEDLMRMDWSLRMKTASEGVGGVIMTPNEARRKFDLPPVQGGDTPYIQQQNYSLAALDERDKTNPLAVAPAPEPDETDKGLHFLWKKNIVEETA
jgi:HK97 family phage portal protein